MKYLSYDNHFLFYALSMVIIITTINLADIELIEQYYKVLQCSYEKTETNNVFLPISVACL